MSNIVIFSALFKPSTGGVEAFTESISKELSHLGHDVTVVTSNTHKLPFIQTESWGEVIRFPVFSFMKGRLPLPNRNDEYKRLWKYLGSKPANSILINTRFYPHSLEALRFAEAKGITPVILEHGSAYITLGNPITDYVLKVYERMITKRVSSYPSRFYGVSSASLKWLRQFDIVGDGVITNSIDAEDFRNSASTRDFRKESGAEDDELIVAFVGRLTPEKGVEQLLDAARLLEKNRRIHFLIAGDGPLLKDAANTSLTNVTTLGRLDRTDVAALLLSSDMLCLPTRSEGFPTVMLEAAACGCIPVMPNVGGVEELLGNTFPDAVLANTNPKEIASTIEHLYSNRRMIDTAARNLQDAVSKNFSWEKSARTLLRAFEAIVQ